MPGSGSRGQQDTRSVRLFVELLCKMVGREPQASPRSEVRAHREAAAREREVSPDAGSTDVVAVPAIATGRYEG
eukprot:2287436-Rhodomonas_salina.1